MMENWACLNIKSLSRYGYFYHKDKKVMRPSHLYNGNSYPGNTTSSLRWRHNDHPAVSNHQPHGCLLNRLFRRRWKKTSKLRVTGLCAGNSPGPVNSPHKGPVTRKMFPFDDVNIFISRLPPPPTQIPFSRHFLLRAQRTHHVNFQGPHAKFEIEIHYKLSNFRGHWAIRENLTRVPFDFQGPQGPKGCNSDRTGVSIYQIVNMQKP